jgi:PII-like signaling protein
VNDDFLKLTTYFGERDRSGGRFLADVLIDLYERQSLETSVMLRGTEGFGSKHRLQTQRLLSLSEDLPLVAVAAGARQRVEPLIAEIRERQLGGLLTVERTQLLGASGEPLGLHPELGATTRLTIYCGRGERIDGQSAAVSIVGSLQEHGVAGATVLLGVDGTVHGVRRRARFFGRNADVPLIIVSVGSGATFAALLPWLGSAVAQPLMTLEPVTVLKRDGRQETAFTPVPGDANAALQRKITIYAGEQARLDGHPLHIELIRRLRRSGASGATALRGIWGYHGDHAPHGDRLLSLRRHVPIVTVVVDRPEVIERLWPLIDEATSSTGLVTSELLSAFGHERSVDSLKAAGP